MIFHTGNVRRTLPDVQTTDKVYLQSESDWDFVTRMTMIVRDILFGNAKLDDMGWQEEALGKNAIAGGFH